MIGRTCSSDEENRDI